MGEYGLTVIPPSMMDPDGLTTFPTSKFANAARNATAEARAELAEEEETRKARISTLEHEIRDYMYTIQSIYARLPSNSDMTSREHQSELEKAAEIYRLQGKKIKELESLKRNGGRRRRRRTRRQRRAKRTGRPTKRRRAK